MGLELNLAEAQRAVDTAGARVDDLLKENPNDEEGLGLQLDVAVAHASLLQWQGKYAESVAHCARGSGSGFGARRRDVAARHPARGRRGAAGPFFGSAPCAPDRHIGGGHLLRRRGYRPRPRQPYREQLDPAGSDCMRGCLQDIGVSRQLQRAQWALGTTLLELKRPREAEPILPCRQ